MVVCNWIYRTAHRQRRISTFVIVLLILSPGNTDPNRYSSIFKEESDIGTFPAQDVASSFVDPIFHKCSINLKCIFVVKDTATGQYSTYSYKDQIPLNRTNLRVWQKHFERKGRRISFLNFPELFVQHSVLTTKASYFQSIIRYKFIQSEYLVGKESYVNNKDLVKI